MQHLLVQIYRYQGCELQRKDKEKQTGLQMQQKHIDIPRLQKIPAVACLHNSVIDDRIWTTSVCFISQEHSRREES